MDKNIIKIVGLILGLIVIVAIILLLFIKGIKIGSFEVVSISGIGTKKDAVKKAKQNLEVVEGQYLANLKELENEKEDFSTQKDAYEKISDETITAITDATKEEEYFIEYLWITLGNYAAAHDLALAVIEPGGTVSQSTAANTVANSDDKTDVSTGTGINGNSQGVTTTANTATTENVVASATSSADALTVQVRGTYMDLADFVFEVENDKSLRFRLDNISMKSAGGTEVITSFNVKDFTVLKAIQ